MQKMPGEFLPRILTGVVLLPWLPLTALFAAQWLPLLWAVLWLLCLWEWANLAGVRTPVKLVSIVFAGLIMYAAWRLLPAGYLPLLLAAGAVFWLLVVLLLIASIWPERRSLRLLMAVPVLLPAYIAVLLLYQRPWDFIYLLLLVWLADSAAWFCGRNWGRHKLAPAISPGKTVEGVAGAAVAIALLAVLWSFTEKASLPVLHLLMLSLLVFAASVLGDLLESYAKRVAGRKDSGSMLPGHGGFMDRMDSMCAAAPVFGCSLWLLSP